MHVVLCSVPSQGREEYCGRKTKIKTGCDVYLKDFTSMLERLEQGVKDKCDPAKVKEVVREEINAIPKAVGHKVNGSAQDSV